METIELHSVSASKGMKYLTLCVEHKPMNPPEPTGFAILDMVDGKPNCLGWLSIENFEQVQKIYEDMKRARETKRDSEVPAAVQAEGSEAAQGQASIQEKA